jgi:glycosyltransferase involved in cell wall biosynthesis
VGESLYRESIAAVDITIDATPLLGRRTGIGQYVAHLLGELPAAASRRGVEVGFRATTWTARGGALTGLPSGVRQVGPRLPARALRAAWTRTDLPPIETLVGRTDVFHGTNFVSPPTRRAREVLTVHDLTYVDHVETVSAESRAYARLVPRALDRGAHVVTPSAAVAARVREVYDLPAERVSATPLGVSAAWFEARPADPAWLAARGLPRDYVVFVGSLDPRKNLPRLLDAHAVLRRADPDVPDLVLAGPAGRDESLTGRRGVHLTGWLEDDDLRALVAGAGALALPSLDEGFGLPAVEALAAGRPVVVSRAPALLEVVGPHGFDAPASDVAGLADALARAVAAPDEEPDRAARRRWAQQFTWARTAELTLDAYLAA